MFCLTGVQSILLHTILILNTFVWVIYAKYHNVSWILLRQHIFPVRMLVACWLRFFLFVAFYLSFLYFIDSDFNIASQIGGLVAASAFSGVELLMISTTLAVVAEVANMALLLLTAQLSAAYIPAFLQAHFGVEERTSQALVLLLPIITLVVMKAIFFNGGVGVIVNCIVLSLLMGLAYQTFYASFGFTTDVCCDLKGDCPIYFGNVGVALTIVLSLLLIIFCFKFILMSCVCRNPNMARIEKVKKDKKKPELPSKPTELQPLLEKVDEFEY